MQRPVCVEMPTDGIRMEGNEQNVIQLAWNQGQARIQISANDRLSKDKHVILNSDK
jgi:hypothetical protein